MDSHTALPPVSGEWMNELSLQFLAELDQISDDEFDQPSALPEWSRSKLIAHVHCNAQALQRLIVWARTEVETPMYASSEARSNEIDACAGRPAPQLRKLVTDSADALRDNYASLTPGQRNHLVRTAQGRQIRVSEVCWMRCRELGVHLIDLRTGRSFNDLPPRFVRALVDEIVSKRFADGEGDSLASWLTGREVIVPSLKKWL